MSLDYFWYADTIWFEVGIDGLMENGWFFKDILSLVI